MRKFTIIALLALAACGQEPDNGKASEPETTIEEIAPDENVSVTDGLDDASIPDSGNGAAPAGNSSQAASPTPVAVTEDWTKQVARTPEGGYRMGNPNAKIKLVEYGARTCPACGQFARDGVRKLETQYVSTGMVSYEFRDFMVHGMPDVAATLVGQCGTVSSFFPVLAATYANQQKSLEKLGATDDKALDAFKTRPVTDFLAFLAERGNYPAIAESAGLPKGRTAACLADKNAAQRLVDQTNAASKIVDGTPAFLINGRKVDGHDWTSVEKALKAAGI